MPDKIAEIKRDITDILCDGRLSPVLKRDALIALIAQRETALRSENEALKQQGKEMVEALRDALTEVDSYSKSSFRMSSGAICAHEIQTIEIDIDDWEAFKTKIDAVLPKGEVKCSK